MKLYTEFVLHEFRVNIFQIIFTKFFGSPNAKHPTFTVCTVVSTFEITCPIRWRCAWSCWKNVYSRTLLNVDNGRARQPVAPARMEGGILLSNDRTAWGSNFRGLGSNSWRCEVHSHKFVDSRREKLSELKLHKVNVYGISPQAHKHQKYKRKHPLVWGCHILCCATLSILYRTHSHCLWLK